MMIVGEEKSPGERKKLHRATLSGETHPSTVWTTPKHPLRKAEGTLRTSERGHSRKSRARQSERMCRGHIGGEESLRKKKEPAQKEPPQGASRSGGGTDIPYLEKRRELRFKEQLKLDLPWAD